MALPSKEAVLSLMKLAESSPETARYLQKKFIALLVANKLLSTLPDLVQAVADYVKNVELQATLSANPWVGEAVPSARANRELQEVAAQDAVQVKTGEPLTRVDVDVIVELAEDSRWERHYVSGDAPVDAVTQEHMDGFFKAWMAEHDMERQDHVMYKATDEGSPTQKVPPAELAEKLLNEKEGLAPYVSQKSRGAFEVCLIEIQELPALEKQKVLEEQKVLGA